MDANRFRTPWMGVAVGFLALTMNIGGCIIEFDPLPSGGGGGSGGGGNAEPTTITLRLINETGATIDPQIFVTGDAITDPDDLFVSGNAFTRFGVGNRGLLGDFDSDSISFDCTDARIIGTRGGLFGDDLENPDGTGTRRILGQDTNFECGETITLRFGVSRGVFVTTVSITR